MMDGAIHFGMGHRVLEAMTNEFGIFVSVQGGGGGENILGSYSRCIEEAVIDAVPSASTTNQLMLPSKSAKKPTDSKSIRVESEDGRIYLNNYFNLTVLNSSFSLFITSLKFPKAPFVKII